MNQRLWPARALLGLVIASNLQAALIFLTMPGAIAPGFELTGLSAEGADALSADVAVRGIAILFIMWNIPYLVAFWHPARHLTSLMEAVVMQATGLAGETALWFTIPAAHLTLQTSILRFIIFDALGLLLLLCAFWWVKTRFKNG